MKRLLPLLVAAIVAMIALFGGVSGENRFWLGIVGAILAVAATLWASEVLPRDGFVVNIWAVGVMLVLGLLLVFRLSPDTSSILFALGLLLVVGGIGGGVGLLVSSQTDILSLGTVLLLAGLVAGILATNFAIVLAGVIAEILALLVWMLMGRIRTPAAASA